MLDSFFPHCHGLGDDTEVPAAGCRIEQVFKPVIVVTVLIQTLIRGFASGDASSRRDATARSSIVTLGSDLSGGLLRSPGKFVGIPAMLHILGLGEVWPFS
ncbi:MAG: hypothetical protein O3A00_07260 [Planctomycetota bacterium]|nr:hypothetical protein [Planctomycetota bacterium]